MDSRQSVQDRRAFDFMLVMLAVIALTVGRSLWARNGAAWWAPYAVWALLVAVGVVRSLWDERK